MTPAPGQIRRFRFNLPQNIAAVLLTIYLALGAWLLYWEPVPASASATQACGRALWMHPLTAPQKLAPCSELPDSLLVSRAAALLPDPRWCFLAVGFVLGGALWWVTRRQFGNWGGYTALAFYCTSPWVLHESARPNGAIPAALAIYGGIYTLTGVAHAMQGPRRKWRPRIVLLAAILAAAACTSLAALLATLLLGVLLMLWIVEGRRRLILPVVGIALGLSGVGILIGSNFSPAALMPNSLPRLALPPFSQSWREEPGLMLATLAAITLFCNARRSRYFGHAAPLLCTLALIPLQSAFSALAIPTNTLCALPFLLTFVGGVFADGYEGRYGMFWKAGAALLLLAQIVFALQPLVFPL